MPDSTALHASIAKQRRPVSVANVCSVVSGVVLCGLCLSLSGLSLKVEV
jgi:hypothetical protein